MAMDDISDAASALKALLLAHGLKLAVAESCTGGLIADRLTDVPGISEVMIASVVTYTNAAKQAMLDVPEKVLNYPKEPGAVSAECAQHMVRGVIERCAADIAIAATGNLGPAPMEDKPEGLVYFATSFKGKVASFSRRFPGPGRRMVKEQAAEAALRELCRILQNH